MIARFTLNYKLAFLLILGVPRGPARRISKPINRLLLIRLQAAITRTVHG